jgi:hypothetical protein
MTCEHLRPLEQAMLSGGMRETYRGQAWSNNCREWVYFDCFIDTASIRQKFNLAACVSEHAHRGTHDGQERGFVCSTCWDAIMGAYEPSAGIAVFRG